MMKRFYIATKGNTTIGVNYNDPQDGVNKTTAKGYKTVYTSNQEGMGKSREGNLNALVDVLRDLDVSQVNEPISIFVNEALYQAIARGTYKYWLLNGAKSTGEVVDENEKALWEEFHELYTAKSLFVVVRNIFKGRTSDKSKFKITAIQKLDNTYIDYCWKQIKELSDAGKIDDSTGPAVDMVE